MQAGLMTARPALSGAAVLLFAVGLAGCDNDERQADRQVQRDLAEARQILAEGGDVDTAQRKLEDAAGNEAASASVRAAADAALAQRELELAHDLTGRINRLELDLSRIVWEIKQLAYQVHSSGSSVAGYQKFDPKPDRDAIAAKVVEAQGGPGKLTWSPDGNTQVPTLSAIKQEISRIEGEISQRQDQVKNLHEQRSRLLDSAEQASSQAEQLKGERAVEVFKRSSDLRKQSGDVAVQIDKLEAEIVRFQRALAISQGQQVAVNELIAQLQDQGSTLDAGWKEIEKQIQRQQQLSRQILGESAGGGSAAGAEPQPAAPAAPAVEEAAATDHTLASAGKPIALKAEQLNTIVAELRKLRAQVLEHADKASKHFNDAYTHADALRSDLESKTRDPANAGRPEITAWKALQQTMEPMQFALQNASAQRMIGALWASEAASLARRISMHEVVTEAVKAQPGLSMPPALTSAGGGGVGDRDLPALLKNALQQADDAYKESEKLLADVIESQASEQLKDAARIGRVLTLHGWALVARQNGDEATAKERINQAIQQRDLAAERDLPLPAMPTELGEPPAKPVATPPAEAAAPTGEQPTTQAPGEAESPEAQAVRAVLVAFADALQRGDHDAARATVQIEPGQEQYFEQLLAVVDQAKKFSEALKAKFGDSAAGAGAAVANLPEAMKQVKITVSGDEGFIQPAAMLNVSPRKFFVRADGQWKVYIGAPADEMDTQQRAMVEKLLTALPQLTSDIEAGNHATLQDAIQALSQAIGMPVPGAAPPAGAAEPAPPATPAPPTPPGGGGPG
jgi:hypothetical protein